MQARAAAVYGVVFLLVAVAAGSYVATAEAPEPALQEDAIFASAEEGGNFSVTGPDGNERTYRVDGFDTQRGQPTASLIWTDEDARTQEEWAHAGEPGAETVAYQGGEYWVRIPQIAEPEAFVVLESPGEDGNVSVFTDDQGNWLLDDGQEIREIDLVAVVEGDQQIPLDVATHGVGDQFEVGEGEDARTVRVESLSNESVTVSWNEPAENEVVVRQTDRAELNGQNVTAHFPDEGTVQLTQQESEIERYLAAHDDRVRFQERVDGLTATTVLSLVSLVLLVGLAFLPRKE